MRRIAQWNPGRDCWETEQGSLLCEHLDVFSATWPASGTTRGGVAYEQPMWAPPMGGTGSSSLPTPRASRGSSGTEMLYALGGKWSNEDRTQGSVLLPTPSLSDSGRGGATPESRAGHTINLVDVAEHLLPTPTATPYGSNQSPSPGSAVRPSLDSLAVTLLPTPTVMDYKASGGSSPSDVTLTDAVVRTSLGASTNPRFDAGKPSSDDPPLHPPKPEHEADNA